MPFPPVSERFERLEETLQICHQMWSDDDGPFEGTHYRLAETICSPKPVSSPRPPILVGGSGERKTLRLVARYADACNLFATGPGRGGPQARGARAPLRRRRTATRPRSSGRSWAWRTRWPTRTASWPRWSEYAALGIELVEVMPLVEDPVAWAGAARRAGGAPPGRTRLLTDRPAQPARPSCAGAFRAAVFLAGAFFAAVLRAAVFLAGAFLAARLPARPSSWPAPALRVVAFRVAAPDPLARALGRLTPGLGGPVGLLVDGLHDVGHQLPLALQHALGHVEDVVDHPLEILADGRHQPVRLAGDPLRQLVAGLQQLLLGPFDRPFDPDPGLLGLGHVHRLLGRRGVSAAVTAAMVAQAGCPGEGRTSQPARRPPAELGLRRTGEKRSGRRAGPQMPNVVGFHSTGPSTARSGIRRDSSTSASWSSARARAAPMQWWIPEPKVICWVVRSRVMSNVSGSS